MYFRSSTAFLASFAVQLVNGMDSFRSLRDLPFHKMPLCYDRATIALRGTNFHCTDQHKSQCYTTCGVRRIGQVARLFGARAEVRLTGAFGSGTVRQGSCVDVTVGKVVSK